MIRATSDDWECKNHHRYTPENTYITPQGHRRCRTCNNNTHQRKGTPRTIPERPTPPVNWRDDAACATVAVDLWFPEPTQHGVAARAKQICATCPVRTICLQEGMYEEHGVWGGTTPLERKALRRQLKKATA